ncbi:beta-sarcoglycan [Ascaphus truei]|uniref:beta-sarcoglycan n=1 Tax=Ascaphus truei TaxID=8439 RepID=UPI003F5AD31F
MVWSLGRSGLSELSDCGRGKMAASEQSSNGPVKKSMREKAVERRNVNKEHNSNFKAGYIPIDEDRLHKTGLRGRKGNLAICVIVLLFILAVINLIITLVIWVVIRVGPSGCDSMEFHESGLLRFKQVSDMGVIHPLYKSTVGGRRNEDLVITGNNQPVIFQQGSTTLSVDKDKTSITSDIGMEFVDPRTQKTLFSTDYEKHEFHLPKGVKTLNVQRASTERITSNATSDLNIKVDGNATVRGNEGVFIMGKTIEFRVGRDMELKAGHSIVLNGTVMVSTSRLPSSSAGDLSYSDVWERYKLCICADGTLFRVQVESSNMGCQTSENPCGATN